MRDVNIRVHVNLRKTWKSDWSGMRYSLGMCVAARSHLVLVVAAVVSTFRFTTWVSMCSLKDRA
jgi:hypothetical protein